MVVDRGLMDVYPDGSFRSEAPVSRFDYVLALVKLLDIPFPPEPAHSKDSRVAQWTTKYMAAALHAKLIPPTENNGLSGPVRVADLAQWVTLIPSIRDVYQGLANFGEDYDADGTLLKKSISQMIPVRLEVKPDVKVGSRAVGGVSPASMGPGRFSDMNGHWLENTVTRLATKGLLNGLVPASGQSDPDLFYPKSSISRGDFAKLVMGLYRLPTQSVAQLPSDLQETSPGFTAISTLLGAGIMLPDKVGRVHPDRSVTKIEALVMLIRLNGTVPTASDEIKLPFRDVNSRSWAAPYLALALDTKLISPSAYYFPQYSITRAELIALIAKTPSISAMMK
jgi:hypothetical protein